MRMHYLYIKKNWRLVVVFVDYQRTITFKVYTLDKCPPAHSLSISSMVLLDRASQFHNLT